MVAEVSSKMENNLSKVIFDLLIDFLSTFMMVSLKYRWQMTTFEGCLTELNKVHLCNSEAIQWKFLLLNLKVKSIEQ